MFTARVKGLKGLNVAEVRGRLIVWIRMILKLAKLSYLKCVPLTLILYLALE